jgi:hypothetical protein
MQILDDYNNKALIDQQHLINHASALLLLLIIKNWKV